MAGVRRLIRVLPGGVLSPARRQPPLGAGYEHVRLVRAPGRAVVAEDAGVLRRDGAAVSQMAGRRGSIASTGLDVSHVCLERAQLAVTAAAMGPNASPEDALGVIPNYPLLRPAGDRHRNVRLPFWRMPSAGTPA
jgi:hypothetical protein